MLFTELKKIREEDVRARLEEQLRRLIAEGNDLYVEIGPGSAISGYLKKTAKAMNVDVNVVSIDTVQDFKKVTGE